MLLFDLDNMAKTPKIPDIPEHERTPLVAQLLEVIHYQTEMMQSLRDEIAVLKGDKPKPKIKPSGMEKGHFDPSLISYIQYQYFQCLVTQPADVKSDALIRTIAGV